MQRRVRNSLYAISPAEIKASTQLEFVVTNRVVKRARCRVELDRPGGDVFESELRRERRRSFQGKAERLDEKDHERSHGS